jgi:hypothetical protein
VNWWDVEALEVRKRPVICLRNKGRAVIDVFFGLSAGAISNGPRG